ncbi:MAG: DUF4065 domain-containing protein [bacterium]|nr:DUF4065 domain-containing protein [bacterium]
MSIITNDEIKIIIDKYNIGKRPLSIILGLGEVTVTRYLNNEYKPNAQNSELLYSVLNDPGLYLEYLEKNKDKISSIAYGKSKTAVSKILNLSSEKDELLENVAEYIVEHNIETTNLSLQKLLYYCQLFNYVIFDKPMFKSTCNAWEHGPVYEDVYYKYKVNGNNPIETTNRISIDPNIKKLVDAIIDNFGCFSGAVLCYFTHSELPWKKSYDAASNINNEDLKSFALKLKEEYQINDISDIEKYVKTSIASFKMNRGEN